MAYPEGRLEFVILGAVTFAFTLYTFLVWREKRAERLRTAPPTGRMSAYRGALPSGKNLAGRAPVAVNTAALGTFAFAFLVPIELLVDRMAARMARRMSPKGVVPLSFVPAWRTGMLLLRRDPRAENEVERLHRLQVLVNLFLMCGLAISAFSLSAHPALLLGLGTLLLMRAFHTRLLGKVAKSFDPAADRLPGLREKPGAAADEEQIPPWLSRALTRRAENRLGAAPLGSARPLPPERTEVRVAVTPSSPEVNETATAGASSAEEPREEAEADEADGETDDAPVGRRRTIG
jgi:hypothetical protein